MKVYRPQDKQIQVHQSRVTPWPRDIVSGYYWYGEKKCSPGCPPKRLDALTKADARPESDEHSDDSLSQNKEDDEALQDEDVDTPEDEATLVVPSKEPASGARNVNWIQSLCLEKQGESPKKTDLTELGSSYF